MVLVYYLKEVRKINIDLTSINVASVQTTTSNATTTSSSNASGEESSFDSMLISSIKDDLDVTDSTGQVGSLASMLNSDDEIDVNSALEMLAQLLFTTPVADIEQAPEEVTELMTAIAEIDGDTTEVLLSQLYQIIEDNGVSEQDTANLIETLTQAFGTEVEEQIQINYNQQVEVVSTIEVPMEMQTVLSIAQQGVVTDKATTKLAQTEVQTTTTTTTLEIDDVQIVSVKTSQESSVDVGANGTNDDQSTNQQNDGTLSFNDQLSRTLATLDSNNVNMNNQFEVVQNETIPQLAEDIITAQLEGRTEVELELTPEHLGKVVVKLISEGGELSVQLLAENSRTQMLLNANIGDIRAALTSHQQEHNVVQASQQAAEYTDQPGQHQKNDEQNQEQTNDNQVVVEEVKHENEFLKLFNQMQMLSI